MHTSSGVKSTTLHLNTFTASSISLRVSPEARSFISISSRITVVSDGIVSIHITSWSFASCFIICDLTASSPRAVIVMRELSGSSVSLTVRLSMLNPRLAKRLDTRISTPYRFATMAPRTNLSGVAGVVLFCSICLFILCF